MKTRAQKKIRAESRGRVEEKNRSAISGAATPSHSLASEQMDVGLRMSPLVNLNRFFKALVPSFNTFH